MRRGTVIPGSRPSREPPHSTYRKERFEPTILALVYQVYELFGILDLCLRLKTDPESAQIRSLKPTGISSFVQRVLSLCDYKV